MTCKAIRRSTNARRRYGHKRHGVVSPRNKQPTASPAARAWRCPQSLWTNLRTAAMQSGFTPYAARPNQLWRKFDHARKRPKSPDRASAPHRPSICQSRANAARTRIASADLARYRANFPVDAQTQATDCAKQRAHCPQSLWTRLRTHAMRSCFTPCAARAQGLWRNFDHRSRAEEQASPASSNT